MSALRGLVLGVSLLLALAARGDDAPVYASNYDVLLRADGNSWQVRSRARVYDGHAIPVELGPFRVDVAVAGREEGFATIELRLFEKSGGEWHRISAQDLSFPAQLGTPVEFAWNGAGLELDVAVVLSMLDP